MTESDHEAPKRDLTAVLAKVRKLRTLAESAAAIGNMHEANAALAQASRLLERYRVDESELEEAGADADTPAEERFPLYEDVQRSTWRILLGTALCEHYGVACYQWTTTRWDESVGKRVRNVAFRMIGRRSDVKIVRYLFSWLVEDFPTMAEKLSLGRGRTWINNFLMGAVKGVDEQLESAREAARQGAMTTALVRLDARLDQAMELLPEDLKKRTIGGGQRYDPNAERAGYRHGKSVPVLSKPLPGAPTPNSLE
jgi:hypothetical protein